MKLQSEIVRKALQEVADMPQQQAQYNPDLKRREKIRSNNNRLTQIDEVKIIITKCLSPNECTGFYTDTISGSILIECRDPMHSSSV